MPLFSQSIALRLSRAFCCASATKTPTCKVDKTRNTTLSLFLPLSPSRSSPPAAHSQTAGRLQEKECHPHLIPTCWFRLKKQPIRPLPQQAKTYMLSMACRSNYHKPHTPGCSSLTSWKPRRTPAAHRATAPPPIRRHSLSFSV